MGGSSSKKNPLGLSDVDVECFKATFDAFDVDGGGSIDAAELKGLLNAFGVTPTDEELETMIQEVDEDGSGEIEFEEFLRMVVLRMERNMMGDKNAAQLAFNVFDEKETGEVDSEELRNCLIRAKGVELGPDEVNNMIKIADRDGNGTIEFDELWQFAEERIKSENGRRVENLSHTTEAVPINEWSR